MSDMPNVHLASSHLLYGKSIAIVGGGPSGLALARLLQLAGVEVRVYERDESPCARNQGGSLDLHEGSGQLAMRRCGLIDRFHTLSRPEGQCNVVYDKHATLQISTSPEDEDESAPEIDRGELLELLRGSLSAGTVAWGHRLESMADVSGGGYALTFSHGASVLADIVIGCDGIRSKVRAFLGRPAPTYTGVTFIETRIGNIDTTHPDIARIVGLGSAMSLGDHKGLLAQRNADGSIRIYVACRVGEHWMEESWLSPSDPHRLRQTLMSWFDDWSPSLVRMLKESEDAFLPWPLYAMATDTNTSARSNITLMGDSAHAMPPFLGAGANMALLDAVELAVHLTRGEHQTLGEAIQAFEGGMMKRMTPMVERSVATQDLLLSDDAPAGLVALMMSNHPAPRQ